MLFSGLDVPTLISRLLILFVSLSVHEFAHAWAADRFGDPTPRMAGRLTLNPLAHLDPLGSLMLLVGRFGWAKPVPVNPYALQRHSRAALMWVSLAGPLSNFLLAVLTAIPFRLHLVSLNDAFAAASGILPSLSGLLLEFIVINLSLMLFNLIPLAPLDGEKIAEYFFPPAWRRVLEQIRPYGPLILLLLVISGSFLGFNVFGLILGAPMQLLLRLLILG
jgi:Zn-dependent protease